MISFVTYFSSAQDVEGFVALNGHGCALAEFTGGPAIEDGTYRVEGNSLVRVESTATTAISGVEVE